MLPLVALQLTATVAVSPVAARPTAVKSATLFCRRVRILGESTSRETVPVAGSVTVRDRSHPTIAATASNAVETTMVRSFRRANRHESLCLNVIAAPSPSSRGREDESDRSHPRQALGKLERKCHMLRSRNSHGQKKTPAST